MHAYSHKIGYMKIVRWARCWESYILWCVCVCVCWRVCCMRVLVCVRVCVLCCELINIHPQRHGHVQRYYITLPQGSASTISEIRVHSLKLDKRMCTRTGRQRSTVRAQSVTSRRRKEWCQ